MYRKDSDRWLKHADFILLDMICLQIAFVLAYITSGYGWNPYEEILYRNMAIFIELVDVVGLFLSDLLKGVLKTECYHNFIITVPKKRPCGEQDRFQLKGYSILR